MKHDNARELGQFGHYFKKKQKEEKKR